VAETLDHQKTSGRPVQLQSVHDVAERRSRIGTHADSRGIRHRVWQSRQRKPMMMMIIIIIIIIIVVVDVVVVVTCIIVFIFKIYFTRSQNKLLQNVNIV